MSLNFSRCKVYFFVKVIYSTKKNEYIDNILYVLFLKVNKHAKSVFKKI